MYIEVPTVTIRSTSWLIDVDTVDIASSKSEGVGPASIT